jgi:phage tail-like protein
VAEDRYYGVYRALVLDTRDPAHKGRVRVQIPALSAESPSGWALITTAIPSQGDTVLVAFEEGDEDLPVVIGVLWSGDETAPPTSRPERLYARFRYRIEMEGREVAGASNLSGLTAVGGIVKRLRPGYPSDATLNVRSEYESITIERGITHDREFESWSRTTSEGHGQDETLRRDIVIRQYDEAGEVVGAFRLLRCWVSEFQAVPDLDANANAVAIEHLKLEHEGWERDTSDETRSEGKRAGSLDDSPEE